MDLLRSRPGDFDRTGKAVFFLEPDAAMGWLAAPCFVVGDGEVGQVGAKGLKEDLSVLTTPDLDDVLMHIFILVLAGTDRNGLPVDLHAVPFAGGIRPGGSWVIGRDWKLGNARINNRQGFPVSGDVQKVRIDPAFIGAAHPDPAIGIRPTNELDICSAAQGIQV